MTNPGRVFILMVVVLVLGALVFLMTWEIPAPTRQIEEPVPAAQLPP
jgi:hypothetical protein